MSFSLPFSCLASLVALFICNVANAADFSIGPNGFGTSITGEIRRGDVSKLGRFLMDNIQNPKVNFETVFLNSPGGDVAEALRLGEMMRSNLSSAMVPDGAGCYSACTILWAGGVDRHLMGRDSKLGFHRLSFERKEVDLRKSQAVTVQATQKVTDFFQQVGFPALLIEKMNQTPPTDMYVVDYRWLIEHDLENSMSYQPTFFDVVEKQCGNDPFAAPYKQDRRVTSDERDAYRRWVECGERVKILNREIMNQEFLKKYPKKK